MFPALCLAQGGPGSGGTKNSMGGTRSFCRCEREGASWQIRVNCCAVILWLAVPLFLMTVEGSL